MLGHVAGDGDGNIEGLEADGTAFEPGGIEIVMTVTRVLGAVDAFAPLDLVGKDVKVELMPRDYSHISWGMDRPNGPILHDKMTVAGLFILDEHHKEEQQSGKRETLREIHPAFKVIFRKWCSTVHGQKVCGLSPRDAPEGKANRNAG